MNSSTNSNTRLIAFTAVALSIVSGVVALLAFSRTGGSLASVTPPPGNSGVGLLQRIDKTGELHVGYGVYPPYTLEDPNSKKVSGFSVEVMQQIGKELKCKLVWKRLNWNTMSADLKRGQFDVIADPIFQTIPRAREFAFSDPYAFFADGIAVVRKNDSRFSTFDSLNRKGITISVGQGWASESLVKTRLKNPTVKSVQTSTDLLQVFNDVLSGRSDVAIADGADAERFVKEHPSEVKALWLDNPPAYMPAGFALKPSDVEGARFLTVCLRNLRATGVLASLEKKYKLVTPKAGF